MVITGLVVTGSALAGYWGVANYRRTPNLKYGIRKCKKNLVLHVK